MIQEATRANDSQWKREISVSLYVLSASFYRAKMKVFMIYPTFTFAGTIEAVG
jgi:hypothetical protein